MHRYGKRALAALATAVAVAGCGTSATALNPRYWLVKTCCGNYANVYVYPPGNVAGTAHAVYLGTSNAAVQANLGAAAARLGIPIGNITNTTQ
jgi:hypothetical protein